MGEPSLGCDGIPERFGIRPGLLEPDSQREPPSTLMLRQKGSVSLGSIQRRVLFLAHIADLGCQWLSSKEASVIS